MIPEARGIRPISVVTMGDQLFPATGVTVQVICVGESTTMLAQSTWANAMELILAGKAMPWMVRVVPECVKEVIYGTGAA